MRFAYISGKDSSSRRQRILGLFKQGKIDVLISSTILDEGADLPSIETLILAGGGKAEHRQIQRIGRALRAAPGKDRATIFDFMDEGYYLGKHAAGRLAAYEAEPAFTVHEVPWYEFDEVFK